MAGVISLSQTWNLMAQGGLLSVQAHRKSAELGLDLHFSYFCPCGSSHSTTLLLFIISFQQLVGGQLQKGAGQRARVKLQAVMNTHYESVCVMRGTRGHITVPLLFYKILR